MGHLWDALCRAYDTLGFGQAAGGDEMFRQLVLARIIEPASKQDSLRVLDEAGIDAVSYPTSTAACRPMPRTPGVSGWPLRARRGPGLGLASLVIYDVSTLYFETDAGTGSVSRGSPRNAAWTRRSPWGC